MVRSIATVLNQLSDLLYYRAARARERARPCRHVYSRELLPQRTKLGEEALVFFVGAIAPTILFLRKHGKRSVSHALTMWISNHIRDDIGILQ